LIYILFFVILIGLIINELSKYYVLEGLSFHRYFSKKLIEPGEEFFIEIVIENKKIIPVTFLQVVEELPGALDYKFKVDKVRTKNFLYHTMTFFILPFQRIRRKYLATCYKRGRYIFGNVELLGGDFFGLKVKTKSLNYMQDIVVLPKKMDIEEGLIPYGDYNGDISVKRWIIEDPTMIIGVKEYTGREPAKTIHWPLSLKHGELLVKNFDFTFENNVMILLNVECSKPYWFNMDEESIEKCISVTRGVAEAFNEKRIPFGFSTNSLIYGLSRDENTIYPGIGDAHLYLLLEYLGRVSYNVNLPFEETIKRFFRTGNLLISTFVIITPYVLKEYIPIINSLDTEFTKVIVISINSDNFPYLSKRILKYEVKKDKNVAYIF